jgi:hypothetical protein
MSTESKENKESAACCDPKEFKGMFEMMNKCFISQSGAHDCSAIMESIKKGGCCSPATEKKKKKSCS